MTKKVNTSFDRYFQDRMRDKEFESEYKEARDEIDTIDKFIRMLDEARIFENINKAELARRIGCKPEILRRLFSSRCSNPTLSTVIKVADALNLKIQLVQSSTLRTNRFEYSTPSFRTSS